MRHCVTCKSVSKTTATKKRLTRRITRHTSKALLLSLVLSVIASLSLLMPSALQAQAEGGANDTSYAMSIGSKVLEEAAKRSDNDPVSARFYLGQAPWGDINPEGEPIEEQGPALWDVLGPANTDQTRFKADHDALQEGATWGVFSSTEQTDPDADLTSSSILAISHNVLATSNFSYGVRGYQGSNLMKTMDGLLSYLTEPEKAFTLYTYKTDAAITIFKRYELEESQNILQGSQFFPLSGREIVTYWPNKDEQQPKSLRKASGASSSWWMRDMQNQEMGFACVVTSSGGVFGWGLSTTEGVRPAFNANFDDGNVVFTTYAGPDYVLAINSMPQKQTTEASQSTYRLTLHDSELDGLSVTSSKAVTAERNGVVNISYTGSPTGRDNTYTTALIASAADPNHILYASHIKESGATEATLDVPSDIADGTYKLYLIDETDNNLSSSSFPGKLTNSAGSITDANTLDLTVKEADPTNIILLANGGSFEGGTNPTIQAKPGQVMPTLTQQQIPTRNTFVFDGFWTSQQGGIKYYNQDGTPAVDKWDKDVSEDTLYAHWLSETTITLDAAGGTLISTGPITAVENQAMPELTKEQIPTRTGYIFKGYFASASPESTQYYTQDGTSAHVWDGPHSSNVTLIAHWQPISYTVTFEGNGQDIGEAYTQEMTYDQGVALKPCAFIKEGYTFSSWNIEQHGGGTSYENEQTVLNLADTQGANVYLYAQWEVVPPEETINITFDAGQGNIFILTDEGIYENQGHTYTLEGIQKDMPDFASSIKQALSAKQDGYTFKAWSPELPDVGPAENTTYKALYTKNPEPTPPVPPTPKLTPGWKQDSTTKQWYYVYDTEGNTYRDGWHWIEDTTFGNHWYYFKEDGFIAINEWIFTDAWYYVSSSGAMNVGTWNFINGAWYGFNWNGTMCKGWTFDSNYHNWFYCDPTSGAMYTNCWSFINGSWYGFWANGEMCRGWVWDNSYRAWFYCSPSDGHMYTNGWYRIDGRPYYFNASGLLV